MREQRSLNCLTPISDREDNANNHHRKKILADNRAHAE